MSESMDSVIERAFFLSSRRQMENIFAADKRDTVSVTFFFLNEYHSNDAYQVKKHLFFFYQCFIKYFTLEYYL